MRESACCVYCGTQMNRIENHPQCRTVEHMIPQVSVSFRRTNGEGDFHVCRKCNSDKSRTDEVLGIMCRMAGEHQEGSFDALSRFKKAIARNDSKFLEAYRSARKDDGGASISIPLTGSECYRYGTWLGKGVYFIKKGKLLPDNMLVWIDVIGHAAVNYIKDQYRNKNGSEAFDDLSMNGMIPNINGESFLIVGDDAREMFICLNRVFMFHIKLLDKTYSNQKKCAKALHSLEKKIGK